MTKLIKFAVGATVALTATAAVAGAPATFKLDGRTYTYTSSTQDGDTVLEGRSQPGADFRLTVRGNQVSGHVNGRPVAFTVAESRGAAKNAKFATGEVTTD